MKSDNIRELCVNDFVRTVLGPKDGLYEKLNHHMNPLKLYITGILSPERDILEEQIVDGELESAVGGEEDFEIGDDVSQPSKFKSGLNSKSRPKSLGISFLVKSNTSKLNFDICFTWARYLWNEGEIEEIHSEEMIIEDNEPKLDFDEDFIEDLEIDDDELKPSNEQKRNIQKGYWNRNPRYLLLKNLNLTEMEEFHHFNQENIKKSKSVEKVYYNYDNESFELYFRVSKYNNENFKISIYFLNATKLEKPATDLERRKSVSAYIFQPQIRVNFPDFIESIPFDVEQIENAEISEENRLKMLYSKKRPYGQGHMCSIVWKGVDPEKMGNKKSSENSPPFYWLDGEIIENIAERNWFTNPQIRSEYTPLYQIGTPSFKWRQFSVDQEFPPQIEQMEHTFLDPEYLAENSWNYESIEEQLNQILKEYQIWIDLQKKTIIAEKAWWKHIAEDSLEKHERLLMRISNGMEILKNNSKARLSFCFANKVISAQYKHRKTRFFWRPFQISFLLLTLKEIVQNISKGNNEEDNELDLVDLIWFPTGGGKTEAYLLVAAFTMAYRRLIAYHNDPILENLANGTILISRYTLRLLTIQQFRRALKMILYAEILRVEKLDKIHDLDYNQSVIGWIPENLRKEPKRLDKMFISNDKYIWGRNRFSIGLWVGSALSPNLLETIFTKKGSKLFPIYGALDALKVEIQIKDKRRLVKIEGDPAQILTCPICNSFLSLPKKANQHLPTEKFTLNIAIDIQDADINEFRKLLEEFLVDDDYLDNIQNPIIEIVNIKSLNNHYILKLSLDFQKNEVDPLKFREWWKDLEKETKCTLLSTDILNPGYFFIYHLKKKGEKEEKDFEIRCLNLDCDLNKYIWNDEIPIDGKYRKGFHSQIFEDQKSGYCIGVPISAFTVDEQLYSRLPTLIVATVDKFAQLSYKEEIGTIFGNADKFDIHYGFYRENVNYYNKFKKKNSINLKNQLEPPELILQDELHLIEGPLGSLVGFYEILIDSLCTRYDNTGKIRKRPKYIASTATINAGKEQVKSLYSREISIFPSSGIFENDSFFLFSEDKHPLDETQPSRLYLGLLAPGYSTQIPLIRTLGSLLQKPYTLLQEHITSNQIDDSYIKRIDNFWTLVIYFNAIKELAAIRAITNQDLISWMRLIYNKEYRDILAKNNDVLELSSRTDSILLPEILEHMNKTLNQTKPNYTEAEKEIDNLVLTTSMFGTGVDVSRLGLMVINGQPKSTSSYIQTTGRIGRESGGLIITFLHAGRPRDLDHYEHFIGFHQALYRYVEPITVSPFAPECINNTIGPVFVGFLRQAFQLIDSRIQDWTGEFGYKQMEKINDANPELEKDPLLQNFINLIKSRWENQPKARKSNIDIAIKQFLQKLKLWYNYLKFPNLRYNESTMNKEPEFSVILGSLDHQAIEKKNRNVSQKSNDIRVVFENAPNSLRGVEPSITFGTKIGDN